MADQEYDTTHRECLPVVFDVLMLSPYPKRSWFTIPTDHDAIRWILNITDVTGRLVRWLLRLQVSDFDVVQMAGVKHQAANASSGLPTTGMDKSLLKDNVPELKKLKRNEEEKRPKWTQNLA